MSYSNISNAKLKRDMYRGKGNVIAVLEKLSDVERLQYHKLAVWGCTHNFNMGYIDTEDKAWYMWRISQCFGSEDRDTIVKCVIERHEKCRRIKDFEYYSDILYEFCADGNIVAQNYLQSYYRSLVKELTADSNKMSDYYMQCFFHIALRVYEMDPQKKNAIISDYSKVLEQHSEYDLTDIMWIFEDLKEYRAEEFINDILVSLSESDIWDLLDVYDYHLIQKVYLNKSKTEQKKLTDYLKYDYDSPMAYKVLRLFLDKECACKNPVTFYIDISENTNNEMIRDLCISILCLLPCDEVREYAIRLLESDRQYDGLVLFSYNLLNDFDCYFDLLRQIDVNNKNDWHSVYAAAIEIAEELDDRNSQELLLYLYENTLCAYCRYSIVKQLEKRGMIPSTMKSELKYDACKKIRVEFGA